jgi:ubiquinone/menaquinone biosynthesis C-methylase UbiE
MEKLLLPFGIASREMKSLDDACNETYRTKNNKLIPTPIICKSNPYVTEFKNSYHILEIGCGIGRNTSYILDNTNAIYYGIEPNSSMRKYFWNVVPLRYHDRVSLLADFSPLSVLSFSFDYVICTFVFQHITYRPTGNVMNIDEITKEIRKYTTTGTIWFMLEHENEENNWISKWLETHEFTPSVYIKNWREFPELCDRGDHNLLIIKE